MACIAHMNVYHSSPEDLLNYCIYWRSNCYFRKKIFFGISYNFWWRAGVFWQFWKTGLFKDHSSKFGLIW